MSERTWMQKSGATPGKLALVGCLAVGLVIVLGNQQASDVELEVAPETPLLVETTQQAATNEQATVVQEANPEGTAERMSPEWPELSLEDAIATDPFVMSSWYLAAMTKSPLEVEVATEGVQQLIEPLKLDEAKIVMISNGIRVATIGSQNYRVGDSIEGFQIIEINRDGVVLTEID